jgi:2-polyprenyl-3-methyl-5-hydroxy-6-metoxy-1,4-benzoquinol methylase
LSLDRDFQEKIHEANVSVHRFEAKYYELVHPEVYSKHEQKRIDYTLKMVNNLISDNQADTKKVLDVGAGTGNLTGKLLRMGYQVVAVDISAEMCEILKRKYSNYLEGEKLTVIASPIEDVIFDRAEFDLITCYSVLHHLPDYVDAIKRLLGFLKKGGVIYLDHEISPFFWKRESSTVAQMVKLFYSFSDPVANILYFKVMGVTIPSLDYSLSDYWYRKEHPLDHEKIFGIFVEQNFDFFRRIDYYLKFRSWVLNPIFYLFKQICKPDTSLWIAKK